MRRAPRRRRGLGRPCIDCGRTVYFGRSRCPRDEAAARTEQMPYRGAYFSPQYQAGRKARLRIAGGRCEALVEGRRCGRFAEETHHVVPLSTATSLAAAIALCTVGNLRAVCWSHNPRGGGHAPTF